MDSERVAKLALAALDLTSLGESDTDEQIVSLCERANTGFGGTAAVCIYPRFIPIARRTLQQSDEPIKIATVCVFPHGRNDIDIARAETLACIAYGADEVDTVIPYRQLLEGDETSCRDQLAAVREACGDKTLKVILETGELRDPEMIRHASRIAIDAGADFIKTSTGKVTVNATLEAASAMLDVLSEAPRRCGLKIAGGVRTVADAANYLELAADRMGADYLAPETFRFGASGLLDALLAELSGASGVQSSTDY